MLEKEKVNSEINPESSELQSKSEEVQSENQIEIPTEDAKTSPDEMAQLQDKPKENTKETNFRLLREEKERIEKERNEMQRKLRELENLNKQTQASKEPEQDEEFNVNPDDLIEGKHFVKVTKKIKALEKQLEQYQQNYSAINIETRLKTEYPDFDKVVSKDNIEVLKLTYPELAQSIDATPDLYIKAKSAYTLIRKLGIEQDNNGYEKDHELAKRNISKPRPATSAQQGESPLSMANAFANGLSEDMKKQLYKEMLEARNNKGFI